MKRYEQQIEADGLFHIACSLVLHALEPFSPATASRARILAHFPCKLARHLGWHALCSANGRSELWFIEYSERRCMSARQPSITSQGDTSQ